MLVFYSVENFENKMFEPGSTNSPKEYTLVLPTTGGASHVRGHLQSRTPKTQTRFGQGGSRNPKTQTRFGFWAYEMAGSEIRLLGNIFCCKDKWLITAVFL